MIDIQHLRELCAKPGKSGADVDELADAVPGLLDRIAELEAERDRLQEAQHG